MVRHLAALSPGPGLPLSGPPPSLLQGVGATEPFTGESDGPGPPSPGLPQAVIQGAFTSDDAVDAEGTAGRDSLHVLPWHCRGRWGCGGHVR